MGVPLLVRLKGFQKLTSIEKASQIFLDKIKIKPSGTVTVSLHEALNRVLAEDIVAEENLPRFDRSAVDGYAVKAEDTVGASQFNPKIFLTTNNEMIDKKQTRQVWTGSPIPKGANAVAMLENTKQIGNKIEIWVSVTPGENISKKGEDIRNGKVALKAGTRLKPHHLGLIAALGFPQIKVIKKPKIAILATGNELVEMGGKPSENQIFEVNRLVLLAMCNELGVEPLDLGIAKAIITTGGTSVGAVDLVPEAVNKIGKPGVVVHGIAMRPAMPTALAVLEGKPMVILSGNPVAAIIGFEVFAKPLIWRMLGLKRKEGGYAVKAKITRRVTTALGRKTFVRVRVFQKNEELFAEPVSARGSGIISTMTKANGYVVVPENREGLEEGESVSVQLFDNVEEADVDV
jgi:molybdopterin molybdotransferase